MSVKHFIFIISILFASTLFSQYDLEEAKKDTVIKQRNEKLIRAFKENTYLGTGANLLLGNLLLIYASPQIGYEFIPKVSAGVLSLFQYQRFSNAFVTETYTVTGVGVFLRYRPFDFLVLESSYNRYNLNFSSTGLTSPLEAKAQSLMMGLGYSRSIGKKSYTNILVSYDLIGDPNNPEPAILRTGNFALYYKFGLVIYPFNN